MVLNINRYVKHFLDMNNIIKNKNMEGLSEGSIVQFLVVIFIIHRVSIFLHWRYHYSYVLPFHLILISGAFF